MASSCHGGLPGDLGHGRPGAPPGPGGPGGGGWTPDVAETPEKVVQEDVLRAEN